MPVHPRGTEEPPAADRPLGALRSTIIGRRRALGLVGGGLTALVLAACGSSDGTTTPATSSSGSSGTAASGSGAAASTAACEVVPEETAGPYPGDGSNGPDVLGEPGIVRSDITSSFGSYQGTADGVPLEVRLNLVDADSGCVPFAGAAVYLWHCDREGRYSLYSEGATDQNYLRGVQEADDDGTVVFRSIFPACYDGRWPHIHFEVFPSLDEATDVANKIATSQIAFPEDACDEVYSSADGYSASVRTLSRVSLESDNVFGEDSAEHQLGSVTGSVEDGYTIELAAAVSASTAAVVDGPGGGGAGGGPPGRPGS